MGWEVVRWGAGEVCGGSEGEGKWVGRGRVCVGG